MHLNISDLMTANPPCVDANSCLHEVAVLMRENKLSCLVITHNKQPIGVITERDMVRVLTEVMVSCSTRPLKVSDFMTPEPICLHRSASLYEALVIIQARHIRHLPVVDDQDQLVGLLTQADIADAHFQAIEYQRDIIEHQIRERTRELEAANAELKALTLTDGLLEIGNRRSMEVDIQYTHKNALRYNHPYSLALLDVDCFKLYNDHYGHGAGDNALKAVTNSVRKNIRTTDRLYRYGGEELLLLLPETPLELAPEVLERILKGLREEGLPHCKSQHEIVTLSAGFCVGDQSSNSWQEVVETADQWLYKAKESGRNCAYSQLGGIN